jgi:transposase
MRQVGALVLSRRLPSALLRRALNLRIAEALRWELTLFTKSLLFLKKESQMPNPKPPYPAQVRQQMFELVAAGRRPSELARNFGCHETSIVSRVRTAKTIQAAIRPCSGARLKGTTKGCGHGGTSASRSGEWWPSRPR